MTPSLWDSASGTDEPLSRRGLARLALSACARELSDKARHQVAAMSDEWARPGEAVQEAAIIMERAQELLERAVIWERERATPWSTIGEALGDITKQAAQERFGDVVNAWRELLHGPRDPEGTPGLPEAVENTARTAQDLDEWVCRHREFTDVGAGELHPVSAYLPRASLVEQINWLLAEESAVRDLPGDAPNPAFEAAYFQHKATLMERIAEATPGDLEAAEAAVQARVAAEKIRVRGA
jgi:hypothetical protein